MVRVAGFEPTASWTRTKRDTKLRHTRIKLSPKTTGDRCQRLMNIIEAIERIVKGNRWDNAALPLERAAPNEPSRSDVIRIRQYYMYKDRV